MAMPLLRGDEATVPAEFDGLDETTFIQVFAIEFGMDPALISMDDELENDLELDSFGRFRLLLVMEGIAGSSFTGELLSELKTLRDAYGFVVQRHGHH